MARLDGSAFHVPESRGGIHIITPGFIKAAHARGFDIVAWTINDEADMARLVKMGVDGLITRLSKSWPESRPGSRATNSLKRQIAQRSRKRTIRLPCFDRARCDLHLVNFIGPIGKARPTRVLEHMGKRRIR